MRTTVVERIDGRRIVPYDRNDHTSLERVGRVEVRILEARPGSLRIRVRFELQVRTKDDKKSWGLIECLATTSFQSERLDQAAIEALTTRPSQTPDWLKLMIEGGFSEDILLPMTVVARFMHLPALLLSPFSFATVFGEKSSGTSGATTSNTLSDDTPKGQERSDRVGNIREEEFHGETSNEAPAAAHLVHVGLQSTSHSADAPNLFRGTRKTFCSTLGLRSRSNAPIYSGVIQTTTDFKY